MATVLPPLTCSLREAYARTDGALLTVSTGCVTRTWEWTGRGFATRTVALAGTDVAWCTDAGTCDWQLPDLSEPEHAELRKFSAVIDDDEGFTSEHILARACIGYPERNMELRMDVWAYPGAQGLRLQLAVRLTGPATEPPQRPPDARTDRVPSPGKDAHRRFIGYYNDTQRRNDTHQDLIKEEVITRPLHGTEWCHWASAACMEHGGAGLALVKESYKCVNQSGYDTGGFIIDAADGLGCTGWGMVPAEADADSFTPGWATWLVAWQGSTVERQLAFKRFDALRFPVDPDRDAHVQANTWGSAASGPESRRAAREESVLREIDMCADLGIDVLQIDDGWQVPPGHHTWNPDGPGWRPHPDGYPDGWRNVRARAAEKGIHLGLWAPAQIISGEELVAAHTLGGFVQFKLDFASLKNRTDIDTLMRKIRSFIKATGHAVRVNWDVTENAPRFGYFFAREYGCVFLANRKPFVPRTTVYRPHTVLRDLWQAARYLNVHKFQGTVQDVARTDPTLSDAHLHGQDYAAATVLAAFPLFFFETKLLAEPGKSVLRTLLAAYNQHRHDMFRTMVLPVGDTPDNAGWTGFQCHLEGEERGYLLLFRERCNREQEHAFRLHLLSSPELNVTDLMTGVKKKYDVDADGRVTFAQKTAPGFLFLSYTND